MKQSLRGSTRFILAALAASTLSVHAAESLDPITVTTNRMPSDNVLVATTVITRSDIERLQITDLPTLLSRQPGIDVTQQGGTGKLSSIFMRGTNSNHVLLLVDGVKWYSATVGSSAIQDFPVEQIERIEIVRGSRSGLYGSEAIGGVIQIFTRKGQQGVMPYAKLSYGTHNSKQAAVGVSGTNDRTSYSVNFNHQSTDGINATVDTNTDDDGYRNNSISASVNHQLTQAMEVGFSFIRAEGFTEFDPFPGFFASPTEVNSSDTIQQVLQGHLSADLSNNWILNVQLSESRDDNTTINKGNIFSPMNTFNTRHRAVMVNNIITLSPQQTVNIGLDYDIDKVDGTTAYVEDSRDNKAIFASWQGQADKHSWLLSARRDDNEAFGHHSTGLAEWGYWLQDGLQITASIANGFKAPTFNDLYFPASFGFQGNPDLEPETSRSYEIGVHGNTAWANWSINAYEMTINDLISIKSDFSTVENIKKSTIRGVELELSTEFLSWDIHANMSLLKPEDDNTGNILARRAKRLANIHADKVLGRLSVGASWAVSGHRFDDAANTTRLAGYGLVDLRAAYQLNSDWSAQIKVNNLFDKDYQTVSNYNSLDRTAMLTIAYKP